MRWLYAVLLVACSSTPDVADVGSDAPIDGGHDVGVDAFVRTPAPACPSAPTLTPPACGSHGARLGLFATDAMLDAHADQFDRGFVAIVAARTGVNSEAVANDVDARMRIDRFLSEGTGTDFEAFDGMPIEEAVSWTKVAGAYAGAGAVADAYRYAVLRDEGADCDEIDAARTQLHASLDGMHRAVAITGVRGVIARGYQRRDLPGWTGTTTPLFDASGNPLPTVKTNGTFRDDNSGGMYPDYVWEDSCSRDMLIGWVLGMAAAWEVSRGDATVDAARIATLADDASAIARSLMIVGTMGYDLEIHDADGRISYNGYLNEAAIDRAYIPHYRGDGQLAIMSLGIIAALARVSNDPVVADYLHNDLIRARDLPGISRDHVDILDMGVTSNYSNYNMAFTGGWLAQRYLCEDDAREAVRSAIVVGLYDTPGEMRQPVEQSQSFYDLVALAATARGTADVPLAMADLDASMQTRALATLAAFPSPYWADGVMNCDDTEIASLACVGVDGTALPLVAAAGRGATVVAAIPVPMRIRPASNFMWRSDPYVVNGDGNPLAFYPAVDFRLAYWMGRYLRAQ